jgi:PhnB protein
MHATFKGPGFSFMAADGQPGKTLKADEGNVSLSLATEDASEAERVFNALAQGGNVMMPFADAFWGGKFGILTDKFSTEWMITSH